MKRSPSGIVWAGMVAGIVGMSAGIPGARAENPPSPPATARQAPPSPPATADATTREAWWKPYSPPCVERENVFAFTEKPKVKNLGNDKYEITFAVRGNCDVTAGIVDDKGVVVRHLGSGVLGANAPAPLQKNSLKQTLYWNGKDDLDAYHKEPEKLKVRVMLGLKPTFDRRLGGTSPYDMPGRIAGIGVDEGGVYVFAFESSRSRTFLRKFGHDLAYIGSLTPPPANLPEAKLQGMGYVEYEPGKKAVQSPDGYDTVAADGRYLPLKGTPDETPMTCRPAVVNGRIYYTGAAVASYFDREAGEYKSGTASALHYLYTDGSTDQAGCAQRPFIQGKGTRFSHPNPRLAASPDGKWLYMAGAESLRNQPCVTLWRGATDDAKAAQPFIGDVGKPGSDDASFNGACDVDCDSDGRIYVCDELNNRAQIFGPDGKHLKTLKAERPVWVGVHRKTGAVYLLQKARVEGKTAVRVAKFSAFPEFKELLHLDGIGGETAALDSWTARPRLWISQGGVRQLTVWEEQDGGFRKILDFDEEARKQAGANDMGGWHGGLGNKVWCDPVRERVHVDAFCFDLPSGNLLETVRHPGAITDVAFDKKGYMHGHFDPYFYQKGVGRYGPDRAVSVGPDRKEVKTVRYPEVPYDYGVDAEKKDHVGILPVKDQAGLKDQQVELGVNMRGDVAEECNISYVPKMDDVGTFAFSGGKGAGAATGLPTYEKYLRKVQEMEKRGDAVYFIKRRPGLPLAGATVWTFDRSGELREECAVIAGLSIYGVNIDEDGKLYFTVNRQRLRDRKVFLAGRMGVFGGESGKNPFMGTLIKSAGKDVRVLAENGSVMTPFPLEQPPTRPPEVGGGDALPHMGGAPGQVCWVEGAEWFYAGASPVLSKMCPCARMRGYTDWYKRSFVPEAYRHSIGIVDANGNLILHMGQYGNLDSGDGPKSKIPVGGDNIAISMNRFVSATDNYAVFDDNGERITVVKLNYHAEETVGIGEVMSGK